MQLLELTGLEALRQSIRAAQQARLNDPVEGVWEAGDLAWWWRQPRASDAAITRVWANGDAALRAVRPIVWTRKVTVEVVGVPDAVPPAGVADAIEQSVHETQAGATSFAASVDGRLHDEHLVGELLSRGWTRTPDVDGGGWTSSEPAVVEVPDGVTIRPVAANEGPAHHMAGRLGTHVQQRLQQTGLYDHRFDLTAVRGSQVVGNALGWLDTVTATALVEPVGVVEVHQRRGIASALVSEVIRRLMAAGASRVRINWEVGGPAEALYRRLGFGTDIAMSQLRLPSTIA